MKCQSLPSGGMTMARNVSEWYIFAFPLIVSCADSDASQSNLANEEHITAIHHPLVIHTFSAFWL
jgi:hypothetical protein